jgi:imidazolonepropionase-like amidohydrolase
MASNGRVVSSVIGASVFGADGEFAVCDVAVRDGRFAFAASRSGSDAASGEALDGAGLWLIPGVYDCHTHLSWSDFHKADREGRSPAERRAQTASALEATLRAGVVAARDAGGADAELRDSIADGSLRGPRLQVSIDMLGPELAGDSGRLRAAVDSALDRGAQWIKLIATESIGHPGGSELTSYFSDEEFRVVVDTAATRNARVMVHAWGGRAISSAIAAGVASIEHGIFLSAEQARQAAAAGVTYVPTLTIYHEVREMIENGTVVGVSPSRIADVLAAHEVAVRLARDAGLAIALGSDFGTADQHGRNLAEIAWLIRAGLEPVEALFAATRTGAALLGVADGGQIAEGFRADAVLLSADPTDPSTFDSAGSVAAVLIDGQLILSHPAPSQHRTGALHSE